MKEKFLPSYYMQENFTKLQHLQQDGKNVEEYGREFETIIMRYDLQEDDHQTLPRFLNSLDSKIRNIVELQPYIFLDDFISLAHKVDKQQRTKMKEKSRFTSSRNNNLNLYQRILPTPILNPICKNQNLFKIIIQNSPKPFLIHPNKMSIHPILEDVLSVKAQDIFHPNAQIEKQRNFNLLSTTPS